jgi:LacI family transcriptional regulator
MQSQVESFIMGKIESGDWPRDSKIPSERELSIDLEVSRTTVRNAVLALTLKGFFDRKTGQGTFVRQPSMKPAKLNAIKGNLGYVVCKERSAQRPIAAEAFYFDIFAGIEEETVRSGRHLLFQYLDDCENDELSNFGAFLEKVDGVVVDEARNPALLDLLVACGVPAVLIGPTAANEKLDIVTMDIGAGVRKAIAFLRSAGHAKIGIVNGPLRLESARIRYAAWKEEMEAAGMTACDEYAEGDAGWSAEAGFVAAERLIKRCSDLSAIFCANDLLAVGALSALQKLGRRVPEDVSVIGFDDSEWARHSSPPLTTMRIYSRDMARSAVRRVLERIENRSLPPIRIEYPIDLVARDTHKEVIRAEK